ncbi:hypothetical protein CEE45_08370 [Candidatus Heimdallarchaeota archaeon B3_Heim]|nr:MAG: hypothetical protein CEE45_08370 [Candidatus Heimdallarchaeota archaeon B3_Heim]
MKKLQMFILELLLILSFVSIISANAFNSYIISSIQFQTIEFSGASTLPEEIELLYPSGYHNLSQVYEELDMFNKSAVNLINYSDIGYSYYSNPIPLITLTNEKIPEYTKGETFIVAHHHAREFCTIEHVLRMIRDLLNEYGTDETTTFLLDHFIIYIIVTLNPDALNIALYENEWQRKAARPIDEDGDGLYDEDPPEDIDGDGRIREFAIARKGVWEWSTFFEGIDNDNDSLVNEDRIGGVDLNRNYPFHWNDNSTDSGWGDDASSFSFPGSNPLSEPESLALTKFVVKHNFTQSLSLHSGTNTSLLGWSYTNTSQAEASMYTNIMYYLELGNLLPESFFAAENELDYTTAGEWGDWMYTTQQSIPMTLEIYHMTGSELWYYYEENSTHETWTRNTLWEYFNPPAEKLDSLHNDLMPFEKYWIGLTPSIEFLGFSNQSISKDEYEIAVKVTTGSQFFNTTDNPRVFVSPSHSGIIRDIPSTIPTLLRNSETRVRI